MNHALLTFIGLIGIGVVIGATLDSLSDPDIPDNDKRNITELAPSNNPSSPFSSASNHSNTEKLEQLEQTIQALQSQVQAEAEKRQQLEQKLVKLEKGLIPDSQKAGAGNTSNSQAPTSAATNPHRPDTFNQNVNWFNEQALIDAGIDQAKVSHIKNIFEQAELDKLYIRDQATREGWMGNERYNQSMKEIADRTRALRSELNDDEYDAYLYAAGRSNRVIVESVLSNSPANNAGILPGDVILSYDNERIYNWSDLTGATSKGTAHNTVAVTVVGDGQQQQVYIPRGPLGVRIKTDSVAP
ncbi:PDZ domain-containing protein [Kaarinaea lacus]